MTRWTSLALLAAVMLAPGDATARSSRTPPASAAAAAPAPPNAAETNKAQPAPPGWRYQCESAGRSAPLTCAVEETAVLTQSGQILAGFTIRVAQENGPAVALIQIPVGVFLPSGLEVQVDDGPKLDLPLQTCEQRSCFAGTTLDAKTLDALRGGKTLKVSFANLNKQKLTVSLPLNGFGPAFDKIK